MSDTTRFDTTHLDEEVERELTAYASARLSPDRFATTRMRAFVIEQARQEAARAAAPRTPGFFALRLSLRGLAAVGLVAVLAISGGAATALAASPGGPLYGVRVQIETALLPSSGAARADAQIGLLNERADEITSAVDDRNSAGAEAAADAYGNQVDSAIAGAAAQRAALLDLRATLVRQLAHFESMASPNDPASANIRKLVAKTQSAIAAVDAKLAALPSP